MGNGSCGFTFPLEINDIYKYFLKVIDIFSGQVSKRQDRYLHHISMKSLFLNRKPVTIQSIKCTEFVSAKVPETSGGKF